MTADAPITYMKRIRTYYQALGYDPYVWARFESVPFLRLKPPLPDSCIALITTAAAFDPSKGEQGPGAPYNASAKFYQVYSGSSTADPDLRISHVAIDRAHTTAEDQSSYFPLPALRRALGKGQIGRIASRFHGLPTNRSQRTTLEVDCPELVRRVVEDGADAAILVPNCPVCHQSCSLAARALEAAGVTTVIMGTALDIVQHVGVPCFLFSDFPLGNSAGRPNDSASHDETLALALRLLAEATSPRTSWVSPLIWPDDPSWKSDYCNVGRLSASEIASRKAEYAAIRAEARKLREL